MKGRKAMGGANFVCKPKKITELRKKMTKIRQQGEPVLTNYFNQCNDYPELMTSWIAPSACVFCWPDNGVNRVYFYASDMKELSGLLSMTDKGTVIDFITRDKDCDDTVFLNAGYQRYMEYGRFEYKGVNKRGKDIRDALEGDKKTRHQLFENEKYGELAQVSDAEEIDRQLREKFDPYEAHFYSLEQLRENIKKGWVWIAKEDGKIVGANIFEIQGQKCYGVYLYNNGSVEVLTSLQSASNQAVAKMGINYYYCWMNLSNKRILRYNILYNGYVHDGTYNFIYVKS